MPLNNANKVFRFRRNKEISFQLTQWVSFILFSVKEKKTKQNKTKQNKTKQNKTKLRTKKKNGMIW